MVNLIEVSQFWNSKSPPEEVETCIDTWRSDTALNHTLYNEETAALFISNHLGEAEILAYQRCAVPAMQADFFRYCVLFVKGGLYVDADTENLGNLNKFAQTQKDGVLMMRQDRVANDVMYLTRPRSSLMRHCIDQAINNIDGRVSNNVWLVTGPGILTSSYNDESNKHLFDDIELKPVQQVKQWIKFRHDMEYKQSDDDWRRHTDSEKRTIFRDELYD